ncbi:MAG: peptidyl-prolyl cis-trans isomerase [Actinomycetota bacterium]|jgi:parvulin-like peptidyl-prolyl isomerase|nr:peptidyl-prolyl cis-trans isomerase [Actinomycetota bacterium]
MKRPSLLLVLFALVPVLAGAACGSSVRPNAATVDGNAITQTMLDDELEAIQANKEYVAGISSGGSKVEGEGAGTLSTVFVGRVLTRQIFLQLVHAEFERKKLKLTPADLTKARPTIAQDVGGENILKKFPKAYQDTLARRNAEVAKLQESLSAIVIDDAAIKKYYDENPDQFRETCVSHILISVASPDGQIDKAAAAAQSDKLQADAIAVKKQLDAGADFAAMAKQYSADASNKDTGGNLDCGPPGRFVPEFETAMDALPDNTVSAPVKTDFGWHLIKVTERKLQPLADATPQIQQSLQGDAQAPFSEFLRAALAKAKITVNPRYGTFSKDPQQPGIIPPNAPTTTEPAGSGSGSSTTQPGVSIP